ncbi:uncharacterized protein CTRU02_214655 [Colletotrichum truncatum]|uniref:Uncharacterized protein n=1 Tax=Colletotrichum truncatum TaxID=5467 RepID=A0ACC3YFF0_COLTU|nr:uncharacterized protein CTRU02_09603 [Colletotrichum truncatum]KAF6788285.1 hypothetical protein CTRU02_09603 [Colletotrichum truncatum]
MRIGASPLRTSHPNPSDATLLFPFQLRPAPGALYLTLCFDNIVISGCGSIEQPGNNPFYALSLCSLFSNLALTTS